MTTTACEDTVSIPAAEYASLKELEKLVAQLERDNVRLADQLAVLLNRVYGRKSERIDPAQLRMFAEELGIEPAKLEAAASSSTKAQSQPAQSAGHGRSELPEHLPREVIELDLPEDQRACSVCGEPMTAFGEEVTERAHVVPAKIVVKRYVRPKYACAAGHGVATAPLPGSLIDKAKYEPSVYAHVVVAKYGDHLPLHRLSGIFKRHGLSIPKSTMWDLLSRVDEIVAQPVLTQMRSELLAGTHIQADETPVTVRVEDGRGSKTGYVWIYRWKERQLFDFTLSRARDGPRRFLGSWRGTLQTDGYSGYDEVTRTNDLVRAGCWAHARRKVKEAVDTGSAEAGPLLAAIGQLFDIERDLREQRAVQELSEDDFHGLRGEVRAARGAAALDHIRERADELWRRRSTLPKSQLGKSLTYLDNQWGPLTVFVDDPVVEIHNNDPERSLRHVVTGRKNWLVFGSPRGGAVGSRLFSLVATAKALDIHPEAYLEDVIRRIDTTPASEIARLTPWAWADEREADLAG